MFRCLSNRAACWLKLGLLHSAVTDTTTALQIIDAHENDISSTVPHASVATAATHARIYARRGAAYTALGEFTNGTMLLWIFADFVQPIVIWRKQ